MSQVSIILLSCIKCLMNFSRFTTSERQRDYYCQKWTYEFPHELLNDLRLKKIMNFIENPWTVCNWWQEISQTSKKQFLTVVVENCEKYAVKYSIGKPMVLNFVKLSIIPSRKLYMKGKLKHSYKSQQADSINDKSNSKCINHIHSFIFWAKITMWTFLK